MPLKNIKTIAFLLLCLICQLANAQINVDFSVTNSTGCGFLQTQFLDQSSSTAGNIVSWQWSDGISSTQQNPTRFFTEPGIYTICLQVTDSEGNQGASCKENFVVVHALPEPNFTVSSPGGCVPATVTFSDSTVLGDAPIVNWNWDLSGSCGNIQNTTNEDITCTYTISDSYTAALIVTDANGCIGTVTKEDVLSITPAPELNSDYLIITEPDGCSAPHTTDFAYNLVDTSLVLTWDFGNGETFEGANPEGIEYAELGVYPITLILTNPASLCADTMTVENAVRVGSEASFTVSATIGCENQTVFTFTDTSPDAATSVSWDFGDPSTETDVSTASNPSYTYSNIGCFTVTLDRVLANGCPASVTLDTCIQVVFRPTVLQPNSSPPMNCEVPHSVSFDFAEIGAPISSWVWDFGDGTTSEEHNPTHEYTDFGNYPVTLTIYNEAGCERVYDELLVELQELQAVIDPVNVSGCTPVQVTLSESSQSLSNIDSWDWQIISNDGASVYTSGFPNPTLTVVDTGIYDVQLIVTNTQGCTDTTMLNDVIEVGQLPVIDFGADPLETCIEIDIQFTDNSSPFVEQWYWEFSNGQNSFDQNPVTSYLDTGYYDISLVGTHNGCANSLTQENFIRVMAPVAKFQVINFCEEPYKRKFQNTSIDANFVEWDFGVPGVDTDVSTEENPVFYYPEVGTYTITLTVYNSVTQCSHVRTETITITDPNAAFTVDNIEGCLPFTLPITQNSVDAQEYLWSAPGATISNPTAANPSIVYNSSGTYSDVQLVITDVNNCKDTMIFTEDIFVGEATASFTQSIEGGCMPLSVEFFENSNSLYANVVGWEWEFGNGLGTSSEQNPTFIFEQTGLHNVSLTVTDEWGCSVTETIIAAVEVTSPTANFEVDTLSCTWAPLSFDNTSQGVSLDYEWDFGDGETSTEKDPTHLFMEEGDYTVCLTVTDKYNCIDTKCMDTPINIADPVAIFAADSTFASCPPLAVNFENLSQNAVSYTWDYGDNSGLSNLIEPTHLYTVPGSFDVTLIAERTPTCIDTTLLEDLISLGGPEGSYTFDLDTACAPATITFTAESSDDYMYIWDFGEGVLDTTQLSASSETVTYTYESPGQYSPSLIFVNSEGCARPLAPVGSILVASSTPDFTTEATVICNPGETVTFQNASSGLLLIQSVEWIFEGGTPATSTDFNPTVSYNNPGEFDVTMITFNGSCYDTLVRTDYIKLGETPNVAFEASAVSGCSPLTVNFTDISAVTNTTITGWNWDFGNGNTSSLQNPTNIFNGENGTSFTTTLTITTADGCTGSYSEQINLLAVSDVSAGEDVSICLGETTLLNGVIYGDTTGLNYFWTPSESLSCTSCLTPVASPLDTTTYTLIVSTSEGCTSTSEVTVVVKPYPLPVVEMSADTTICLNSFTQLYVDGGDEVYSYDWNTDNEGLSCYDNCRNPLASPLEATTYVVTVTTSFGCSAVDSVSVDVIDESTEFASEDRTICEGDTVHLGITSGFNPYWEVNDYLSCASCPDPVASPSETTNYIVRVTTNSGCEIKDSVLITTISRDAVDAGDDQTICGNSSTQLSGIGEGTVVWSPAESLDDPTVLNPTASPSTTTTYQLSVQNGECFLTDSVVLYIKDKVEINTEDVIICEGDSIELLATGDAATYDWFILNDSVPSSAGPIVMPSGTVSYMVIGSDGLCVTDTAFMTVNVNPAPDVSLAATYPFFPTLETTIIVQPQGADSIDYNYSWSSALEVSCEPCQNLVVLEPVDSTIYNLEVTNGITGCSKNYQTKTTQITTCPADLIQVPSVFSPNDDGVNDYMEVLPHPVITEIKNVRIFNRWGALVYEGADRGNVWDGTFNGEPAEQGVYLYFIEAVCPVNNSIFMKKGDITLVR